MESKRLSRGFFDRPTLTVARDLLGKILVRKIGRKIIKTIITETEAYVGPEDLASHAAKGKTERTEVMFGPPGHAYVYMIYGIYHCLNIVTEKNGYPAAVLIRGIEIVDGLPRGRKAALQGPGKLCRELKIDKSLNREDIIKSDKLWLENPGLRIGLGRIKKTKRIGIDYAGKYKDKLWRFVLK